MLGGRSVLGGGPEGVMFLEPVADGAVHADVVASVLGLDPLVPEDLVALFEEVLPEVAVGDGFRPSVLTIDTAALPEPVAGFLVTH